MNKIFKKYELLITISLIVGYVVINSFCVQNFGIGDYKTTIANVIFTIALFGIIVKCKLGKYLGISSLPILKGSLYFIPLIITVLINFLGGINNIPFTTNILFYIFSMLLVGFIEEVIFRGFLYKMMAKDNKKTAILVSSITFGIGHIVNLLNGAEVVTTLIQICYAVVVGFLFVIVFEYGKSLWPCIITHSLTNALSIFGIENSITLYISPIVLVVVAITYAMWIVYKNNKCEEKLV